MPQPLPKILPAKKRIKTSDEVSLGYPKKTALGEARRCPQCSDPVCRPGCPLGIDIPAFIRLVREGDVSGALSKIKEQNPFPSVCGRLCPAPCEKSCIFEKDGAPIGIRALERYAADHGRVKPPGRRSAKGRRVAVVGSGPAGLTAAAFLARLHYDVTVFEAMPKPGGVLRYGIPEFRFPKKTLDREIRELEALGVEFRTGWRLGQTMDMADLKSAGYEAALLAFGAGAPKFLDIPGTHLSGVFYGEEILWQDNFIKPGLFRKNAQIKGLGDTVAVLGFGSAALDCARCCVRRGKTTTLVFDRLEEELRVYPADREQAREEGVIFEPLAKAVEIFGDGEGRVTGIKGMRLDYADPHSTGRWELTIVPGSEFTLDVQSVVIAWGHQPPVNLNLLLPQLTLNSDGTVWTREGSASTGLPNVFAAGDAVRGAGAVVNAIASGRKAAEEIHLFLSGDAHLSP
ncbi:MAG: FAD-dependent oxidoreductase [Candidatus Omnitrophota bacterium]|nr:FAD-dependent oxidoreductase [Candidatus Omnitrophota bacterium]MDZ4243056.1 FAD-dependent oxidoreductase [Candidatus Omnitrophota bacterium]